MLKKYILPLLLLLLALGILVEIAAPQSHAEPAAGTVLLCLLILFVVCLMPTIYTSIFEGRLGVFEVVQAASIGTFIYLCAQVVPLYLADQFIWVDGTNYSYAIPKMTMFASLALISFYLGYYRTSRVKLENGKQQLFLQRPPVRIAIYLVAFSVIILLVMWIRIGGISLASLYALGEAGYGAWDGTSSGSLNGFLFGTRSSIAVSVLLVISSRNKLRWNPVHYFIILVPFLLLSATGSRTAALNILLAAVMLFYLERNTEPKTRTLLILLFALLMYIGLIGYFRTGRDLGTTSVTFGDIINELPNQSRLAISSSAIIEVYPSYVDYSMGKSYLNGIIVWIPSAIWSGKSVVINALRDRALLASYLTEWVGSWFAWVEAYRNFGVVGIVGVMSLFGAASGMVQRYYFANKLSAFARIYVIIFWLYLFTTYTRPDPSAAMARLFQFFWPVVVVHFFALRMKNRGLRVSWT